ncbi:MAG TPA: RNA chaperone Hfq [Clostridia bacterium]|nr:RNA chaperone Hfq [Clostridia bacterium]
MPYRAPQSPLTSKKGKTPPPEETFEESSYLKWLGEKQKPVSVKLMDGEIVRGWIEYYDKHMIRLTREGAPNLFIFKHEIMYIAEGALKDAKPKRPRTVRVAAAAAGDPGASLQAASVEPQPEPAEPLPAGAESEPQDRAKS